MKTTMKQIAAGTILGLLLTVGNVHAEGKEVKASASCLENNEPAMQLENWMIDDSVWNTESSYKFETENEETLKLENWMISDANWENTRDVKVNTEKDNDLKLESWMTNPVVWNR